MLQISNHYPQHWDKFPPKKVTHREFCWEPNGILLNSKSIQSVILSRISLDWTKNKLIYPYAQFYSISKCNRFYWDHSKVYQKTYKLANIISTTIVEIIRMQVLKQCFLIIMYIEHNIILIIFNLILSCNQFSCFAIKTNSVLVESKCYIFNTIL